MKNSQIKLESHWGDKVRKTADSDEDEEKSFKMKVY